MITLQTPIYFAVWGKKTRKKNLNCNFLLFEIQGNFASGKWATSFHCRHKYNDYNNEGINNISSKFTISCKSIYLSEYFLGLLTIDSIMTVTYIDWESHKQNIFKADGNFWKHIFHIWTLYFQFFSLFK